MTTTTGQSAGGSGTHPDSPEGDAPDQTFIRLREQVLAVIAVLLDLADPDRAARTRASLGAAHTRLEAARFTVAVCGEYKRGKSTLLDAVLGETEGLLPADEFYATRVLTVVQYGPAEEFIAVLDRDDEAPERRPITRDQIADYVTETGNPRNEKRVLAVEIALPNPRLRSGLRWVDTPGVGGTFDAHTRITTGFLSSADALVFVADVSNPAGAAELTFLRSIAAAAGRADDPDALVYVLAKIDEEDDVATPLADLTAKIAQAVDRPIDQIQVVPVSAHAHLDYLRHGDPDDLAQGNFEQFERVLWGSLHRRRANVLLAVALADADLAVQALLTPVDIEIDAISRDTAQEVEQLERRIRERHDRLEALRTGNPTWIAEVKRAARGAVAQLKRQAKDGLADVWHRCDTDYLYRDDFLETPDLLVNQLSLDAAAVLGAMDAVLAREAAAALDSVARSSELDLTAPRLGSLPPPPPVTVTITGDLGAGDRTDPATVRFRQARGKGGVGGMIGTVVGGLFGALVGSVIPVAGTLVGAKVGATLLGGAGTLWGLVTGWEEGEQEVARLDREARRRSIRTGLARVRVEQKDHVETTFAGLADRLEQALVAQLRARIDQEAESLRQALIVLGRQRASTEQDAERRLELLHEQRVPLAAAATQIERLVQAAGQLSGRPGPQDT